MTKYDIPLWIARLLRRGFDDASTRESAMITVEPLQLPMLDGRIAIAATALTHALFATFIVGSSFIGALTETVGYVTGRAHFERLARFIAFTLILTTATVSFMGVVLVFFLNIFWPHFWSTLFRIMFWPLLLEAILFLAEAVFAYAWYYSWEWASIKTPLMDPSQSRSDGYPDLAAPEASGKTPLMDPSQ